MTTFKNIFQIASLRLYSDMFVRVGWELQMRLALAPKLSIAKENTI